MHTLETERNPFLTKITSASEFEQLVTLLQCIKKALPATLIASLHTWKMLEHTNVLWYIHERRLFSKTVADHIFCAWSHCSHLRALGPSTASVLYSKWRPKPIYIRTSNMFWFTPGTTTRNGSIFWSEAANETPPFLHTPKKQRCRNTTRWPLCITFFANGCHGLIIVTLFQAEKGGPLVL
jgi:hypothetical protein